jgi:hypothetical protein
MNNKPEVGQANVLIWQNEFEISEKTIKKYT